MAVSNGQIANQTTFNNAFLSRTRDSSTIGKVALRSATSGDEIDDIQAEANGIDTFIGRTPNGAKDSKPTWGTNEAGLSTDSLQLRIEKVCDKFNNSTGHKHTGAAGDAPAIAAGDVSGVKLRGYFNHGSSLAAVTGTSVNVSTPLTGKTPSTSPTVKGVVVNAGSNKVLLRDGAAGTQGDQFKDADGDIVFGKLTEATGVWTLSFFVNKSGVDTAYNFTAPVTIEWYYQELFNPIADAPVYSELAYIPSDNATQDVIDASATARGLVNTLTQIFAGVKKFAAGLVAQAYFATERADVASAASIAALSSAKSFVKLTGSTATTLHGVAAGVDGQVITIYNGSTQALTVKALSGTAIAADQISITADVTVSAGSSIELIYDSGASKWVQKSGSGSGGGGALTASASYGSPLAVGASGFNPGSTQRLMVFVTGDGAPTVVSANPQIAAGAVVGQELLLIGRSDTNTLTLNDGTGLSLNGPWTGGADNVLELVWTGANWLETKRR